MTELTVGQIGERGLLEIVQAYCAPGMVGDDAAILKPASGDLVISADALVEDVHFSVQTTPPHAVGWRAAAANLSDLAAMGAAPFALVICLGLPARTPISWVNEFYQGLVSCCRPWHTEVVGGDLCKSAHRFVSITVLGTVAAGSAISRQLAQPGDYLVVTGPHGSSRAGLELLLHPDLYKQLSRPDRDGFIKAHQYPQPRLDIAATIRRLQWARVGGMDTSDGLADALLQLCQMSQVQAHVKPDAIPLAPGLKKCFPDQALEWALYGGEDFELLLSLPPDEATSLVQAAPGCVIIGSISEKVSDNANVGNQVVLEGLGPLQQCRTFQHFN